MREALQRPVTRLQPLGKDRAGSPRAADGHINAQLAEAICQRDGDAMQHECRGPGFPLDPVAILVHPEVLPRDLHPLLRRQDRPLQRGRTQGNSLGVVRVPGGAQSGVPRAHVP